VSREKHRKKASTVGRLSSEKRRALCEMKQRRQRQGWVMGDRCVELVGGVGTQN